MPGVIMENGGHTNHDRQLNGVPDGVNSATEKAKPRPETQENDARTSSDVVKTGGVNLSLTGGDVIPSDLQMQLSRLPIEIKHIVVGCVSLSKILERLSVQTYSQLSQKIQELAQMPSPTPKPYINGNAPQGIEEDKDIANILKKQRLLQFAEAKHSEWVKLLVIANWSRRAHEVGKLIDLHVYFREQKLLYLKAVDEMSWMKRHLTGARLRSPDLKTALAILSTGKASWMPDLGHKPIPLLTPRELLKSLNDVNTALSIRLLTTEHDNIPAQFESYNIHSGRVTFQVPGEFEIDLTIASEDPKSMFWFIDFRFLFTPTISEIPKPLLDMIEGRVNTTLEKDGLCGCYKLLHEFVLTHKINEYRKQTLLLAGGKWIHGLKTEHLNRTLSVQYWVGKPGFKSWLLLGVRSGRLEPGQIQPKAASYLSMRWFRDGKEVKDFEVAFDSVNLSAESWLRKVTAMHSSYLLTEILLKLQTRPLFRKGDATLSLSTSSVDPLKCSLEIQISNDKRICLGIEPTTGRLFITPASIYSRLALESYLPRATDPINQVPQLIDHLRCRLALQNIYTHALTLGWQRFAQDVSPSVLKEKTSPLALFWNWFRRPEWDRSWSLVVSVSMGGERWWLFETAPNPNSQQKEHKAIVVNVIEMPMKATSPEPSYSFFMMLNTYAAALTSHFVNLRSLHSYKANYILRDNNRTLSVKLPSILVRLSQILPSQNKSSRTGRPWAKNTVQLTFKGLELVQPSPDTAQSPPPTPSQSPTQVLRSITNVITTARMVIDVSKSLSVLQERVDKDIAFNPKTGVFVFRLRSRVGDSIIPLLIERVNQIERLVDFVEVLHNHSETLTCETLTLGKIIFRYASSTVGIPNEPLVQAPELYRATIDFGTVDTVMRLVLDSGNPHIRIVDYLSKALNGREGLDGVATLLPLTLPILRVADSVELAWAPIPEKGEAVVLVRAVDQFIIRYQLNAPNPVHDGQPTMRTVSIQIKLRNRKGQPWWYISRVEEIDGADEINEALQPVWDSSGDGWHGMRTGAVAQPGGIEQLMGQVDEIMRTLELGPVATSQMPNQPPPQIVQQHQQPQPQLPKQQSPQRPPPQQPRQKPQGLMHQQHQQRQQPTPNNSQSQGQNQGRNSSMQREIVEID